ncbi:MAG: hypothetical protein ACE5J4_03030 [Candidatus Aenigmatarchaeota archaeon]
MDPQKLVLIIIAILALLLITIIIADWILEKRILYDFCIFLTSNLPLIGVVNPGVILCSIVVI